MAEKSLYDILGVSPDAGSDEIRRAYKRLAQKHHPDKQPVEEGFFSRVKAAYEILSNPQRRAQYDQTGDTQEQPGEETRAIQTLAHLFSEWIDKGKNPNPIEELAQVIRAEQQSLAKQKSDVERNIKQAEKKAGRLNAAQGDSLFERVLNEKLRTLKNNLASIDQQAALHQRVMEMLLEYEYQEPEEESAGNVHVPPDIARSSSWGF